MAFDHSAWRWKRRGETARTVLLVVGIGTAWWWLWTKPVKKSSSVKSRRIIKADTSRGAP